MHRRTLLQIPLLAAQPQTRPHGIKLSVRVEPLFPDLTLPQQMAKVAEAGYPGFEFGNWQAANAKQIVALKNRLHLNLVCIVGNFGVNPKGAGLCDPSERSAFLAAIKASVDAARRFETTGIVVLTGNKIPRLSRDNQHAAIVEGLKRAHDLAAPHNITMLVEPVNTLAEVEPLHPQENHLDYYLNTSREAFEIIREVASPYVKVLFDIYHVQIMEGNLIDTIHKNIAHIGHFHVGDVPGRHQPGTGEINYANIFTAIRETGYNGFIGMEYLPTTDAMRTLAEVRALALGPRSLMPQRH